MKARTPASKPMEHRWGERVTLGCPARIVLADGSPVDGCVRNASISGAWIETAQPIPMYSTVSVRLETTGDRKLELPACVVRVARGGFAVEWRDMAVPTLIGLLREAGGNAATLCCRDHVFD